VKLLEAKLDEKIRNFYNSSLVEGAPDAKTKTKLTEAQVSAKIQVDPEYIAAVAKLNKSEANLAYAQNILEAMRQRGRMLEIIAKRLEE
jgi:predicted component of type VI protein secretion system